MRVKVVHYIYDLTYYLCTSRSNFLRNMTCMDSQNQQKLFAPSVYTDRYLYLSLCTVQDDSNLTK